MASVAAIAAQWGPFLAVVAASLVVGWVFNKFVIGVIRAFAKRTKTGLDDLVITALYPTLTFALFFIGVGIGLWWYGAVLPGGFVRGMGGLTLVVIAFLAALTIARVGSGLLRYRAKKEPRWTPAANLGSRVFGAAIWIVAFLLVLDYYGVSITPLITSLGLAGLAVALALQDTLANFFAGVWIQTGKTLWPGHYIKVEDKNVEGFVLEVGWRTTKVRTLPGNIVIIPNHALSQSTITDYWMPEPKMGTSINVVTGLEADPDRVVPMMLEEVKAAIAERKDVLLEEPAPAARLNKRIDNGWEYWVGFWTPYYYTQWDAQSHVLNRIRRRFLKEGVRMPLPISEQVRLDAQDPALVRSIAGHRGNGDGGRPAREKAVAAPPGGGTPAMGKAHHHEPPAEGDAGKG